VGRKVQISYNRDPKLIGTEQVLNDDEAASLVRQGRARWLDTDPEYANDPKARAREESSDSTAVASADGGESAEPPTEEVAETDEEPSKPTRRATRKAAEKTSDQTPEPAAEAAQDK
jgi:hypothetical protein